MNTPEPCGACPWMGTKTEIPQAVKDAVVEGHWAVCHTRLGTCHGAVRYALSKREQARRELARRSA